MIRFLSVRHLAIISQLEMEIDPGFSVLTGETGAGKSIIVGALGLLLGGRASGSLVRTSENQAVVQATFDDEDRREIIIRREISSLGRSRVFIDDSLVTAATLRGLGRKLIDIHGQHAHQALLDPHNHLGLLDAHGRLNPLASRVQEAFERWRDADRRFDQARLDAENSRERAELLALKVQEIDEVAPEPGEDDRLELERRRLANAARIELLSGGAYTAIYERDDSILAVLGGVWSQIEELASLDPVFRAYLDGREAINSQLDDLAGFLRSYVADIETSPARLEEVEGRLAQLERLKKKYGQCLGDVLTSREEFAAELDSDTTGRTKLARLEENEREARNEYHGIARELSRYRLKQGRALEKELTDELEALAIPKGRFEVRFEEGVPSTRWTEAGIDSVEFFFSANPGETLRSLAKVASGGELSRVMLGLKTLASTDAPGKTLIFDEVDAGIGGEVAERVGLRLQQLGKRFQVLCVTHLPQIAAYATSHYHVSKHVEGGRTHTTVERLDLPGRVDELARLMTGGVTPQARASAREILSHKQKSKSESETAKAKGRG